MGEPTLAVTALENAVKVAPNVPNIHFQLARAYEQLGNLNRADKELQTILKLAQIASIAFQQLNCVLNLPIQIQLRLQLALSRTTKQLHPERHSSAFYEIQLFLKSKKYSPNVDFRER